MRKIGCLLRPVCKNKDLKNKETFKRTMNAIRLSPEQKANITRRVAERIDQPDKFSLTGVSLSVHTTSPFESTISNHYCS